METILVLSLGWIVICLIRMSFQNIIGTPAQLPSREAEDVRVEMVDEEPEYELPEGTE